MHIVVLLRYIGQPCFKTRSHDPSPIWRPEMVHPIDDACLSYALNLKTAGIASRVSVLMPCPSGSDSGSSLMFAERAGVDHIQVFEETKDQVFGLDLDVASACVRSFLLSCSSAPIFLMGQGHKQHTGPWDWITALPGMLAAQMHWPCFLGVRTLDCEEHQLVLDVGHQKHSVLLSQTGAIIVLALNQQESSGALVASGSDDQGEGFDVQSEPLSSTMKSQLALDEARSSRLFQNKVAATLYSPATFIDWLSLEADHDV